MFELRKARERGHILEGLAVTLTNVDEVIALIKAAPTGTCRIECTKESVLRAYRAKYTDGRV